MVQLWVCVERNLNFVQRQVEFAVGVGDSGDIGSARQAARNGVAHSPLLDCRGQGQRSKNSIFRYRIFYVHTCTM